MNPIKTQEDTDKEQLKLLQIFYYVLSGLTAVTSCFFLIHVFMGLAMIFNWSIFSSASGGPPAEMGWIFLIMGGIAVLMGWIYAGFLAYAGRCIQKRQKRILILVVAGLSFLHMPFGVALGAFTYIVLLRNSVKELFEAGAATAAPQVAHLAADIHNVPDPDEILWKEIEEKAKRQGAENHANSTANADSGVIDVKNKDLA